MFCSEAGLSALFSSVVPVRRAIIIRDPSTRVSKGFGFVQFAFADDAQTAASQLNGKEVEGRKIKVEFASDEAGAAAAKQKEKRSGVKKEDAAGKKPASAKPAAADSAAAAQPAKAGAKRPRSDSSGANNSSSSNSSAAGAEGTKPSAAAAATDKPQAKKAKPAEKPSAAPAAAAAAAATADDSDSDSGSDDDNDGAAAATAATAGGKASSGLGKKAAVTLPPPGSGSLQEKQHSLLLFGLPPDFNASRLWKRVRKTAGCTGIAFPLTLAGNQACPVAQLQFDSKAHRDKAAAKLDRHQLLGHVLGARSGEEVLPKKEAFTQCRLIVRNLRFNAGQAELKAAVTSAGVPSSAGSLTHVHVPQSASAAKDAGDDAGAAATKPASSGSGRNRGFAFLEFATRRDAQAVLAALNGRKIGGREVAVDWATNPSATAAAASADAAADGSPPAAAAASADASAGVDVSVTAAKVVKEEAASGSDSDSESSDSDNDGATQDDSDSDSSDSDGEGEGEDAEEKEADKDEAESEAEGEGNDDAAAAEADENDDEEGSDDDDDDDGEEDGDNDDASSTGSGAEFRSKGDDVTVGTTLFLRNLPYDANDSQLFELMKSFGPLRYARCVLDRDTGVCKGTGFVQYYAKEGADRALEAANVRDSHWAAYDKGSAESDDPRARKRAELASAVAAAVAEGGLKLNGRVIFAMRAVNKEESSRLTGTSKEDARKMRFDRRHTYLSFEGAFYYATSDNDARSTIEAVSVDAPCTPSYFSFLSYSVFFPVCCRQHPRRQHPGGGHATVRPG